MISQNVRTHEETYRFEQRSPDSGKQAFFTFVSQVRSIEMAVEVGVDSDRVNAVIDSLWMVTSGEPALVKS